MVLFQFQFHIACHELIDVFTAQRGLAPFKHTDKPVSVLTAFILALCEGIAGLIRVAVLTFLFPQGNDAMSWMLYNVLGGGLFLGAFFMATDYVTSPVTKKGQLIFGIGCGLITVFIRYFGSYPEGVCYSILVMNCCTWIIDKYTKPTRFGVDKKAAKEAAKK